MQVLGDSKDRRDREENEDFKDLLDHQERREPLDQEVRDVCTYITNYIIPQLALPFNKVDYYWYQIEAKENYRLHTFFFCDSLVSINIISYT